MGKKGGKGKQLEEAKDSETAVASTTKEETKKRNKKDKKETKSTEDTKIEKSETAEKDTTTKKEKKAKGKRSSTDVIADSETNVVGKSDILAKKTKSKDKSITNIVTESQTSTGKKGKGKLKGKSKSSELLKQSQSSILIQRSISAFIQSYASQQEADEWTWESYTPSQESLKEGIKSAQKITKKGNGKGKGKKGEESETQLDEKPKKGKGKKMKKEEAPKLELEPETGSSGTDILSEIMKMKQAADAKALAAAGIFEDAHSAAVSKKSKKSKKSEFENLTGDEKAKLKKMNKAQRVQFEFELAQKAKARDEMNAKQAAIEEKRRQAEEIARGIEKEKRETADQQLRAEQLFNSVNIISAMKNRSIQKRIQENNQREWEQYLKCDGLPDPNACGQLNTYLHLWKEVLESTTIDTAAIRTTEALGLLELLTYSINEPLGVEASLLENWKWIHRLFREYQQRSLDIACYKLLQDIHKNLVRLNLSTANFERKEDHFAIFLHLLIRLPKRMPNPRIPPPPPVEFEVPDLKVRVRFPESIDGQLQAVRVMYVKYDHLSDFCAGYHDPPIPKEYDLDLYQATVDEWNSKLFYKYKNYPKRKNEPEEVVDKAHGIIPIVPYRSLDPTASTHVLNQEEIMYMETRENLRTTVEEHVINLRQYLILGGIYYLNMFYQPPQPQPLVSYDLRVSRLKMPKTIKNVPIHIKYVPPQQVKPDPVPAKKAKKPAVMMFAVSKPKEEEESPIDEAQRREEEALDKLIFVEVALPKHVLWFEKPTVCQWDENRCLWTTEDIYGLQYIVEEEEANRIIFRTGKFGCWALAVYRYVNLPYISWDVRPDSDGTILFEITAAILLIEFRIRSDLICVSRMENIPGEDFQALTGVYYKLPKLIRTLQQSGIEVFPAPDAFCYVEGTCEKQWPVEHHTYYNMAQVCVCYNFAWSRWNKLAGRRSIVMQMREYQPNKDKPGSYRLLLVTPLKAAYLECLESSEEFSDEIVEGQLFYSDLYNLIKGTSRIATKAKIQNASFEEINTVAELLKATRILSIC